MDDSNRIPIGKIVGPHGVAGAVKVFFYAADSNCFSAGDHLFLQLPDGDLLGQTVKWVKPHNRHVLLAFSGIDNRDTAEAMKGALLLIDRSQLPEPEENTYYWSDLIGMRVTGRNGEYIGVLKEIIATGANDVYVIRNGETETLIPAIASVVHQVDTIKNCMQVTLPEYA